MRVKVEERRGAACRDTSKLNEGLVNVDVGLRAPERIDARAEERQSVALRGARAKIAKAGTTRDLEADEGAQGAVGRLSAGVEVEAAETAEAGLVRVAACGRCKRCAAIDTAAA